MNADGVLEIGLQVRADEKLDITFRHQTVPIRNMYVSPGTFSEITQSASQALAAIDGVMASRSKRTEVNPTAYQDQLSGHLQIHGRSLASRLFTTEAKNYLTSLLQMHSVVIIYVQPMLNSIKERQLEKLPWDIIRLPMTPVADVNSEGEFFLGSKCIVVVPYLRSGAAFSIHPRSLDRTLISWGVQESAWKSALLLDETVKDLTPTHPDLRGLLDVAGMVQGQSCSAIVSQSTYSSKPDVQDPQRQHLSDEAVSIALADNGLLGAVEAEGLDVVHGALIGCVSCGIGIGAIPRSLARDSRCCVLAPLCLVPSDVGVRLAHSLATVLREREIGRIVECIVEWRKRVGPLGLLFRVFGDWTARLEDREELDD